MSEWKEYKIGDIGTVKGGKRLPKGKMLVAQKTDHPYIRIRDLNQQKVLELNNEFEYVDNDTHKEISRYIVDEGDVLLSIVGTIGLVTIVGKSLDKANLTENCVRITNLKEISSDYLYYYLVSTKGQNEIKKGTVGAVQPKLPIYNIQDITISAPDLDSQRNIASILSSLDDKIAVNKKICENLEAQAQALFKHWFVDFAPFKNGNFVESELGLIPEGWRVDSAENFYTINIGKTPPRAERQWFSEAKGNNKIWISISDMGGCGAFISNSKEYLTPEAQNKFNVVMVPVGTVLLSFKLTLGRVAIADAELTTNEAIARFILPSSDYREYTYLYLKQFKYGSLGSTSSIATAVNSKIIKAMPFLMPSKGIIKEFSNIVVSLFDEIKKLNQESSRLSTLRDTLLPKLMSGEIKVNDIEL